MDIEWSLTYFSSVTRQFELRPFVSVEEAQRELEIISPDYIPRSISKVARITGQGDADLVSDTEAIQRFEKQRKAFSGRVPQRTTDAALELAHSLGVKELLYLPKTFGQYLERVRKNAGFSKSAVSQQMGFPDGSIAKYESGKTIPTMAIIRRLSPLAQAAGLPEDAIKREYICLKQGPEKGTLGDIVARERWFAQMGVRELAYRIGRRFAYISQLEADRLLNWQLVLDLEKIAIILSSNRVLELAKELRHGKFKNPIH